MVTIKKILCPVDFFAASQSALKYATALAAAHNAKLRLLHVVAPIISNIYPYPEIVNRNGSIKKESERQLDKMLAKVKAKGVSGETDVTTGDVDLEIERAIRTYKPDLITMGTHGRQGFERWFMGSTTERLLRHSPVPLLTMADQTRRRSGVQFRRILVTTDFSDGTTDAVEYAFTIAQENDAHITLLHVADNLPTEISGEDRAVFCREVDRKLSGLVPKKGADRCYVDNRIEYGTPYQVILHTIEREKIDLVVMNIHGKGMLERALLGSTAERVVRAARCPIILVPPMGQARKTVRSRKRVPAPR